MFIETTPFVLVALYFFPFLMVAKQQRKCLRHRLRPLSETFYARTAIIYLLLLSRHQKVPKQFS
jgi:hypothetical protein